MKLKSRFSIAFWILLFWGLLGAYGFTAQAAPFAYVANQGTVSVIDTATNTVTTTIPMDFYPTSVAITPDGTRAYVANQGFPANVAVIDTDTNSPTYNTVVTTIPISDLNTTAVWGMAITPDGALAYVTKGSEDSVSVIDTDTNSPTFNTVVATIPIGDSPTAVAITPDSKHAYVTNWTDGTVSVIDTATNTVATTIPVGGYASWVAITPDGALAYVTNYNGTVSVIDTATNTVTTTILVGGTGGMAITPDGTHAYVINYGSGEVHVIDIATNSVVGSPIPVGSFPSQVAITPDSKHAYVTNGNDGTVSVIDTATNTVTTTIPVGGVPAGIAITPSPISTPFKAFNIKRLIIDQRYGNIFFLSNLTLGKGNGIDLLKEPVTLKIGSVTTNIPAGSFHHYRNSPYVFVGVIDNVWIKALITPLRFNRFGVQIEEHGADFSGIVNPVNVVLTIGDDAGTTSFNANIK
ncbi:MAG: beta-propeller fold lactonase family protein [Methylosarcina sp.]